MTYSIATSVGHHREVLSSIEAGDGEEAAKRMKNHIESNLSYMEQLIEEMPDYFET